METKEELSELILRLSDLDYESFCMNYSISGGRGLLQFIGELDKETMEEVISEIYINAELEN